MNLDSFGKVSNIRSVLLVETWRAPGLAYDLAKSGLMVYILSAEGYKSGRMPRGVIPLPPAPTSPKHVVGSIEAAVQSVSPDIILPVSEETLFPIWDEAPDWLPLVWPPVEPDKRALYRSKHLLGAFSQSLGVLIPKVHILERGTRDEISPMIDDLGLPVVVKGARGVGGSQVRIAESHDAVHQAVTELRNMTGEYPALQEFLTGATYLVGGLFDQGRPVYMLAAEKTEMYPSRTGPAIALTSRDEPELIQAAAVIFGALGHSGIASSDFVRGCDGRFRFLEVNPRPWGSYSFASSIGIDLVGSWCQMLRGKHLTTVAKYPINRTWAKMPDFLFVPPITLSSILRRSLQPMAIKSWNWHAPRMFMYQQKDVYRTFRNRTLN